MSPDGGEVREEGRDEPSEAQTRRSKQPNRPQSSMGLFKDADEEADDERQHYTSRGSKTKSSVRKANVDQDGQQVGGRGRRRSNLMQFESIDLTDNNEEQTTELQRQRKRKTEPAVGFESET